MRTEFAKYLKKDRFEFQDLVNIMVILRGEGGCPWDREQTHQSIRKNLIEETYEVCEGIDREDDTILCEELGDLLLQVVFHARIAQEEGAFSVEDVCTGICKKLILRHPHIFGDVQASDSAQVLQNWDEIKKIEKNQRTATEGLASVPRQLPALMRADKLQKKAAKAGFRFADQTGVRVPEELREAGPERREQEIGELLFSGVALARELGVDPEEALTAASDKFLHRFGQMEKQASGELSRLTAEELDALWRSTEEE